MQIVRCVVVGKGDWENMTGPFVAGLKENNPALDVVIIDDGSDPPYPFGQGYDLIQITKGTFQKGMDTYPYLLNLGAADAAWNWLLCCKNNLICEDDILRIIEGLSTDTIYGKDWRVGEVVLDTDYLLVPRLIWEDIGPFNVLDLGFYQTSVGLRGYKLDIVTLPLVPYWDIMD